MDAPVAVMVYVSLPDIEASEKKKWEDERMLLKRSESVTLSEFCGIKFGEPSSLSTNNLEKSKVTSYRSFDGKPVTTNSYFVCSGRRLDIMPKKLFDFAEVGYSYKTIMPFRANFCGHFPKGTTRKECLGQIDAFVADINDRYGLNLSCDESIEEEPADFKPGEAPENRQAHYARYVIKDGTLFCQYHFSNSKLYIQIEAGENRYGERIVLMYVDDRTCDEKREGMISLASEKCRQEK